MSEYIENPRLKLAFDFVQFTRRNIFLTGKAGTGKTTFLKRLKDILPKRMVVVAPTGVAAINAGGVTIHSFFQLGFGPRLPYRYLKGRIDVTDVIDKARQEEVRRFSREKIRIIRSLELLVIDEISMVRADLLDAVDEVLRRFRNRDLPFGGVQLLMIGDMQQLAPVVKDDEWQLLAPYYSSCYFFSSLALGQTDYVRIELEHVYRQHDQAFIGLLNRVRDNEATPETLKELNTRFIPGFSPKPSEGYITLTTHNAQAHNINSLNLEMLNTEESVFIADIDGDFPTYSFPTDPELVLKVGAQVMFVKNDPNPGKLFFNGKIGTITGFDDDCAIVQCPGSDGPITAGPLEWGNVRYTLNDETQEIQEEIIGTFRQIPLKLAWAITIHKSQGLTFDRATIDASAAFAFGQVYVALSRCRTLEGLVLSSPIPPGAIRSDLIIKRFSAAVADNQPTEEELASAKLAFEQQLLEETFDFGLLANRLKYITRLVEENPGSLPGPAIGAIQAWHRVAAEQMLPVASRFTAQLREILAGSPGLPASDNPQISERAQKASEWFGNLLEKEILAQILAFKIETDNKQLRKTLVSTLQNILMETGIQFAAIQSCRKGFTVRGLLEARGKASALDAPEIKPATKRTAIDAGEADTGLVEALREWRDNKAKELDQPHFMIMHQKLLYSIAGLKPRNLDDLKLIKGMGKKNIKKFGEELIEIVSGFID
jgi:hypothetical protein